MENFENDYQSEFVSISNDAVTEKSGLLNDDKNAVSHNKIVLIEIESIAVGHRLRSVTKSKVDELAESIAAVGLLQPVVITEDKNLVAGLHRLEAYRQLGITEINAVVIPNLQLQKEIAEIDENLIRNQLTVLEQCEQLKRRKELYEALYPETRRGGYARANGDELQTEDINDNRVVKDAFSNRAASERKVTTRTIQRAIRIAQRLDADVKSRISNFPAALKFTQLMRLAELDPVTQRAIVERMSGEKLSFPQALKTYRQTASDSTGKQNSIVQTNRVVKKWISSFSSLLRQFENFKLTEMQAVIEQMKRDRIDFSALHRLSAECGEQLLTADFKEPPNADSIMREDLSETMNDWRKHLPTAAALPLFQSPNSAEEEEYEKF